MNIDNLKVGDLIMYRYTPRCKWKEGRIMEINPEYKFPIAVEYFDKNRWYFEYRVRLTDVKEREPKFYNSTDNNITEKLEVQKLNLPQVINALQPEQEKVPCNNCQGCGCTVCGGSGYWLQ